MYLGILCDGQAREMQKKNAKAKKTFYVSQATTIARFKLNL